MEIDKVYTKKVNNRKVYVYKGLCDGIPTKWITRVLWDKKISIQLIGREIKYFDSKGNEILVFESDEDEWSIY